MENIQEEILTVVLETLGTDIEQENCANANTAISEVCSHAFNDQWADLIQNVFENMTTEQFNKIKRIGN